MSREDLLARLRERIVAFAASRMGRDLAEDLAQEVLMVLETRYSNVDGLDELFPLSLRILRFKMAASRRKSVRHGENTAVHAEDLPLADSGPSPETRASDRELLDRMKVAIGKLGERCRELFRLKLLGKTFSEIQEEMEAGSINTVYTWDARCRQKLLDLMGGRWEKR